MSSFADQLPIPPRVPMSGDEVLAILIATASDELRPALQGRLEAMSVCDVAALMEVSVRNLYRVLNATLDVQPPIAEQEWRAWISTGLCTWEFGIARFVHRFQKPALVSTVVMGVPSRAVTAFTQVRQWLRDEGCDVSSIRPGGACLDDLRRHPRVLQRLAWMRHDVWRELSYCISPLVAILFLLGSLLLFFGGAVDFSWFVAGGVMCITAIVACRSTSQVTSRSGIRTYRDLCKWLAGERAEGFPVVFPTRSVAE